MKIKILVDNKTKSNLKAEWGLSVYIENEEKKYILDTGWKGGFSYNAKKIGVNLYDVDYGILSHAHCDHANGMSKFFTANEKAKFYLQKSAKENCYSAWWILKIYCGIKKGLIKKFSNRIEYVEGDFKLEKNVYLIPHKTEGLEKNGKAAGLFVKENGKMIYDNFQHEQSLVFDTPKGLVILNSCSHGGADNIVKEIEKTFPDKKVYAILGGFHLFCLSDDVIKSFAQRLDNLGVEKIYTGHCTGDHAFEILKNVLGNKVQQMYSGMEIEL